MSIASKSISKTSRWFVPFKRKSEVRLRLFCFPYAGGGPLIYRKWHEMLPEGVEVQSAQLPGRGNRLGEAPFASLSMLVEAIAEEITPYLNKPFAFFGHSMGGLLGFELARKLQKELRVVPVHLFVSGRRSPQTPDSDHFTFDLSEDEFIEELRRLNGTPKDVLENPELMQLMIPLLRADFEVCQTYHYAAESPLNCPITAIGGLQDIEVTREHLKGWQDHTRASFSVRMLPGDHFFLHSSESALVQMISRELF